VFANAAGNLLVEISHPSVRAGVKWFLPMLPEGSRVLQRRLLAKMPMSPFGPMRLLNLSRGPAAISILVCFGLCFLSPLRVEKLSVESGDRGRPQG